jgi:hypothetical protein
VATDNMRFPTEDTEVKAELEVVCTSLVYCDQLSIVRETFEFRPLQP